MIAQPVYLTDGSEEEMPFASPDGETARRSVSRRSVGRFLAHAVAHPELVGRSVALS